MDKKYKRVFVRDNYIPNNVGKDEVEVSADYVYMIIPEEYICIYHKLLICLADYGEEALKDCKAACKGQNLYIIQCWNMFQSALACHALGLLDKADIKYGTPVAIQSQIDKLDSEIRFMKDTEKNTWEIRRLESQRDSFVSYQRTLQGKNKEEPSLEELDGQKHMLEAIDEKTEKLLQQ